MTDQIRWATPPPHPPRHMLDPDSLRRRRRILRVLTVAASTVAMFASGWGMWTFFADLPRLNHWYLILPMFLLFDLAAVACAWGARINRLIYGRMGIEGWLVWLFATASGLMSASDADGREAAVRFAAPMVAAILFELLIRGERRDLTHHEGPLARIRRRLLARFGLLDDVDQDDEQAARARTAAKLAASAYRVHQTTEGTRGRRRALARYHRQLRTASIRMGFATDVDMVEDVRVHLDALYRSVSGTAPAAVADLNVWQSAAPELDLVEDEDLEVDTAVAQEAAPTVAQTVRITGARRSRPRARLASRRRQTKAPQSVLPPPAVIPPAREYDWKPGHEPAKASALNGAARPPATSAPVNGTTRRPAKKAAASSGNAPLDQASYDRAFQFWQSEKAQGRTPSARQIGDHIGRSKSTGSRLQQQFQGVPA